MDVYFVAIIRRAHRSTTNMFHLLCHSLVRYKYHAHMCGWSVYGMFQFGLSFALAATSNAATFSIESYRENERNWEKIYYSIWYTWDLFIDGTKIFPSKQIQSVWHFSSSFALSYIEEVKKNLQRKNKNNMQSINFTYENMLYIIRTDWWHSDLHPFSSNTRA